MKWFKKPAKKRGYLHVFSRNVLRGCTQFSAVWYGFGIFLHLTAAYPPDYFRTIAYRDAAFATAPVVLAVGIIAALVTDLVLRQQGGDT